MTTTMKKMMIQLLSLRHSCGGSGNSGHLTAVAAAVVVVVELIVAATASSRGRSSPAVIFFIHWSPAACMPRPASEQAWLQKVQAV